MYNHIERLCNIDGKSMNYNHLTVNHCVGFVNPTNGTINTKAVERFWGDLKEKIKGCGHGRIIEQNIFKYLFQGGQRFFGNFLQVFRISSTFFQIFFQVFERPSFFNHF